MKYAIALGSNLGDSQAILESALSRLETVIARSSWYQTKAVTLPNSPPQPDYLNGCAILETSLEPLDLLAKLQQIEAEFGRIRHQKWDARTLDLDILLFDDVVFQTKTLCIPHPRMSDRAFVLVPLAEIAPDWRHPQLNRSIAELVQLVDASGVRKL
ncbi:MAG: 2-amino-4-hydroxy-6-hydroxymethyldihydropteridine diphosphokinase [Leptolyngbya sp. UWPOB_LEPTO1]|uniref:2-amino-4-hydroxy-6- hydroxymethyldihydropteridine diphosphokinase n=1 Tax=Leptolyngbya sp. UWPOB_LEPTO1 TaxID=2815653 RepID=UPI001AC91F55|nr:2-amino-4-hydroxy-6-hydroxymethyldihydropteridine diphosphokinase [Leptolyngbya sp. UWPOB_LEPTO1]MBN8560293.1 2-amino-4-hydroxy-6-hydroxymethyldihydropteridine diphosphokinase [Leptolyngbya sp. UWPOB_LEPTO1]